MNKWVDYRNCMSILIDGVLVNTIRTIVSLYDDEFQYYKYYEQVDW